jgi:hypothetical protein
MKFLPHNDFKYDDATVQIYNSKLAEVRHGTVECKDF